MTLADHLARRIRQSGPLTLADYMAAALLHPEFGYYTTRDPLGGAGDFTTAPEISQMFGELLGLSLAQAWADQGRPAPFTLAELGPGRGTLMADAMRAAGAALPEFASAARVVLIEASPVLRAAQADRLAAFKPEWVEGVVDLPDAPLFLIANEFFDALPVRQFTRGETGWRETMVALEGAEQTGLALALGPETPLDALAHRLADTNPGDVVETCPSARPVTEAVARRIAERGGAALIVDYGDWRSQGDTVQALRDHTPVPVLDTPGQADLTAHVDFEALAQAARDVGAGHSLLTPQGIFLERLGITARAQALARGLSGGALDSHIAAHRRLTHPEEMGNLFKVLGLFPRGTPPPPGLEPAPIP